MYYYNLYDEQKKLLGAISSLSLRYYNPKSKLILCCQEDKAQYARFDNKLYLLHWFQLEPEELKGQYPSAFLKVITEEEYEEYLAEQMKLKEEEEKQKME